MATITTDTFLDSGTARTAGEAWTINNCELTIRTDTRWHANAPASMTGSIGSLTIGAALGGAVRINGTAVRWMAYDTGTGNVPAIGTTITQGGVSGYLLGVWSSITAAPTAVGAAMPATGFLKFREVTGGPYAAGALTGIGANASSPDVAGWIEVVGDASTYWFMSVLGDGLVATGDWFYLDNTTGTAGQILQVPTNGGGSGTSVNAVQIETTPGSGVYEWYNGVSTSWTTALITTDARAKFVQCMTDGRVRIGSDGTSNIGFVPTSGCKVRIPNIFLRNCATGTRASNAAVTSTSSIRTQIAMGGSGGGRVSMSHVHSSWHLSINNSTSSTFQNCAIETVLGFSGVLEGITVTNCANGNPSGLSQSLTYQRTQAVTISNCKFMNIGSVPMNFVTANKNVSVTDTILVQIGPKASGASCLASTALDGATFTRLTLINGRVSMNAGNTNITFTSTDYVDRLTGDTAATQATNIFDVSGSSGPITISGLTFGLGGVLSNTHTYGTICATGGAVGPIKLRNIGTAAAPLNTGNNASTYPASILNSASTPDLFMVQRVYLTNVRSAAFSMGSGSSGIHDNCKIENAGAQRSLNFSPYGKNFLARGVWANGAGISPGYQNTNTHWTDWFSSATVGGIDLQFNNPNGNSLVELSISSAAKSGFNFSGYCYLKTAGDYVIIDMPNRILGHTAFQNVAPTFKGTNVATKHTVQYQLDTTSGYSGTWKTLSAANLSAETLSPTVGFKMKIKVTCTVSDNTNTIYQITIPTSSTQAAQEAALYPLDVNTLSFTGLVAGSEIRCYTGSDPATAVEIGGTESSGTSFSFTHSSGGSVGYIRIFAMGYQPVNYDPYTFAAANTTILVQQTVDRNYVNP